MTREQDWRIHEYMGNDLTGWEWEDERCYEAVYRKDGVVVDKFFDTREIPHYSTTWEGAGLVMEWLKADGKNHTLRWHEEVELYQAIIYTRKSPPSTGYDLFAPQALANALKAAMEERDQ